MKMLAGTGLVAVVMIVKLANVPGYRQSRPAARRQSREGAPAMSEAIVPFTIRVPDSVLGDLKQRLARAICRRV